MNELFFKTNIRGGGVPIKGQYPIKGQSKFVFSIFFDFFGNADTLFLGDFGPRRGREGFFEFSK